MPTLFVLQGPDKGRTYHSLAEPAVIGRTSGQIPLTDDSVSRRHAELRPEEDTWVLADLNSSNGTYVNGQRVVAPTVLKHGDQIRVGSSLLVFGGQEHAAGFTGLASIRDQVDLDLENSDEGASILSAVDASQESVILQAPEAADAVAAWNVVYQIAELIGVVDSEDALLERVVDILFGHVIVDRLALLVRDSESGGLVPQVVRYRTRDQKRRPKFMTSRTIINHVLKTQEGVLCANAMTDERFNAENMRDSIHRLGLRSIICVPIIARNEIQGVFHLDCSMSHHTYTQEQLRLVVSIGRLAGMAIENMRLLESRVRTERLAAAGETVAYLSHYIRNILQGMQGGAEVVELGLKNDSLETAESGWSLVRRNLDRTFVLTMNMLTFSKEREPRIEMGHLGKIAEDVIELSQRRLEEKSVTVLTDFEDMPPIPVDEDGMHQVINNIVLNAIDAAPSEGGRINILTRYYPERNRVLLSIGDNGPGIPADEMDHVFDAFHSSKGHGGTGLGLAAARKIVTELNGDIEFETGDRQGTTFHISLPIERSCITDSGKTTGPG